MEHANINVVEQHAHAASSLWLCRDMAVCSPHYRLVDLKKLDDRLEANVDGLRIAGPNGWNLAMDELQWEEPGEVFPAAVLAIESSRMDYVRAVLDRVSASYELSRPLVSALGWLPWKVASRWSGDLLASDDPTLRRMGIAAWTVQRRDPGPRLAHALGDPDDLLRTRALRAIGELGRTDCLDAVRGHLKEDSVAGQFAAAWSVALMAGDGDAVCALRQFVRHGRQASRAALQVALRPAESQEAGAWLLELAADGRDAARSAVIGAGVVGVPDLVPWLLEQMESPDLARVAGEAFAMITGVDIAYQDLEGLWPEGFVAGPTEDPDDENVEMDPDENLAWPDPKKIVPWWNKHRVQFPRGTAYLVGRPRTADWLEHVLRHGYQRQRAVAALELAIRNPGQPLFEVRAPGFRQQELLGVS